MTVKIEAKFEIPSSAYNARDYISKNVNAKISELTSKYTDECSELYDPDFIVTRVYIDFDHIYSYSNYEVAVDIIICLETRHDKIDFPINSDDILSVFFTDQQNKWTYTGWASILKSKSC